MSQVRISKNTHEVLRSLSNTEGKPMQDIIEKAIDDYRRKAFLKGLSNDYRMLRTDAEAWKEYAAETALWDNTLTDGMEIE